MQSTVSGLRMHFDKFKMFSFGPVFLAPKEAAEEDDWFGVDIFGS